jgi:NADH-quinone oxidoreductase subunit M
LGLPGTSGFVGEFLIIVGVFQKNILVAVLSSAGIIFAAAYMLWLYRRVVFGKLVSSELKKVADLNSIETYILISLAFLILFFGFYPAPLFDTIGTSINNLIDNYQATLSLYSFKTNY